MEIKLNKELQKKLNSFLDTKDYKLKEFLKILKLEEFTFSKEEINSIEEIYKKDNSLREYIFNKKKDNPYLALLDDNLNKKVEIDEFTAYDFITNNNNIIVTNKKSSESYSPAGASVPLVNTRKIKYVH